jgi:hypothetical protein
MTPYRGAVARRLDDPGKQAERSAPFVRKISVRNLVMHLV